MVLSGAGRASVGQWVRRDSNPHWGDFKSPASADWATDPARRLVAVGFYPERTVTARGGVPTSRSAQPVTDVRT